MQPPPMDPAAAAHGEQEARSRIARLVFWYIKRHPLLQPLRDAGHQVTAWHHPEAIWAVAVRNQDGTGYELEERITHPGWWVPGLDSEEDWAARLTTRLAKGIRRQWDERGGK